MQTGTQEERQRAVEEIRRVEGTEMDELGRVLSLPGWAAIPDHEKALFEALVKEKVNRYRLEARLKEVADIAERNSKERDDAFERIHSIATRKEQE